MAEKDEYLRMLLNQAAAEEAFLDRVSRTEDVEQKGSARAVPGCVATG